MPDTKINPVIRRKLLEAGVRNLKEFGYPDANLENILTDLIYANFFDRILEEHKGPGDMEAKALRAEIAKNLE